MLKVLWKITLFVLAVALGLLVASLAYLPTHWVYQWINPTTGMEKVAWIAVFLFFLLPLWITTASLGVILFAKAANAWVFGRTIKQRLNIVPKSNRF